MDDWPHSEIVAWGWLWASWPSPPLPKRSLCDSNVTHQLLFSPCYFSALEGYLPEQSECQWNNHIRQRHDCCAWARSHCSGISANKELNALLCMNVCGACVWILWDGGQQCCQAGKWGWQSGRWAACTWGEGVEGMDSPWILWNDGVEGWGFGGVMHVRWKGRCAYGIEGVGGGVNDDDARARTYMHV